MLDFLLCLNLATIDKSPGMKTMLAGGLVRHVQLTVVYLCVTRLSNCSKCPILLHSPQLWLMLPKHLSKVHYE